MKSKQMKIIFTYLLVRFYKFQTNLQRSYAIGHIMTITGDDGLISCQTFPVIECDRSGWNGSIQVIDANLNNFLELMSRVDKCSNISSHLLRVDICANLPTCFNVNLCVKCGYLPIQPKSNMLSA